MNPNSHRASHWHFLEAVCSKVFGALFLFLAAQAAFAAGMSTAVVPAVGTDRALEVLVWSPCATPSTAVRVGPYLVPAVQDCPVWGTKLPLVVVTHGQGGTRLGHHDTASALADSGFLVVSFNHPGDTFGDDSAANDLRIFESRPAHVSRVITHMLSQWKDRHRIDAGSIGVFGFSRGGYTALALVGAEPSREASAARFCGSWRSLFVPMCRKLNDSSASLTARPDPRVKAIVAVDPLNLFGSSSFRFVKVPVQLWASELGGDGVELAHIQWIQQSLPSPPEYHVAKGAGHFAFLAPCPDELHKQARHICEDPTGFSREQWHTAMNLAVIGFFKRTLQTKAAEAR